MDKGLSNVHQFSLVKQSAADTIAVLIPQTYFKTQLEDLLNGKLHFEKMTATSPLLRMISSGLAVTPTTAVKTPLPDVSIADLTLSRPGVYYTKKGSTETTVEWLQTGGPGNRWTLHNIQTAPGKQQITADRAAINGTDFIFSRNGKQMGVAGGRIQIALKDIRVDAKSTLQWQLWLQRALFQNPMPLIAKENDTLRIAEAQVEDLKLASGSEKSIYQVLKENPAAQLVLRQGRYNTATSILQWKNLGYSQRNQSIELDSFSYQPALSRDSAIAQAPGQFDYMHGVLKKLTVDHIDMDDGRSNG